MRFGAAATAMLLIAASSAPSVTVESFTQAARDRPRADPLPGRGEPVSLDQLVRIRQKNARRKKRRR